jgi:HNH endonuclease
MPNPEPAPIINRFLAKVKFNLKTGCWMWTGTQSGPGYGWLFLRKVKGRKFSTYAHRFSYEYFREPIPKGLTIDHLCRVRRCVNPFHMEVCTIKVNILRGNSSPARNARKTHCMNGHPLKGDNLYIVPNTGYRHCRICLRTKARNYYNIYIKK